MVIGVTGKYCSGKNFIARLIEENNFFNIDVDKIGHEVLEYNKNAVVDKFGSHILNDDETINRKTLGAIVFCSRKKRHILEKILHPDMKNKIASIIPLHENIVLNAALLFPMGLEILCDAVFIVNASLFQRINRAKNRDNLKITAILQRIFSQIKILSNKNQKKVDIYRIDNRKDKIAVAADIERIMQKLFSEK